MGYAFVRKFLPFSFPDFHTSLLFGLLLLIELPQATLCVVNIKRIVLTLSHYTKVCKDFMLSDQEEKPLYVKDILSLLFYVIHLLVDSHLFCLLWVFVKTFFP